MQFGESGHDRNCFSCLDEDHRIDIEFGCSVIEVERSRPREKQVENRLITLSRPSRMSFEDRPRLGGFVADRDCGLSLHQGRLSIVVLIVICLLFFEFGRCPSGLPISLRLSSTLLALSSRLILLLRPIELSNADLPKHSILRLRPKPPTPPPELSHTSASPSHVVRPDHHHHTYRFWILRLTILMRT